jgi:hypothetical protein
MQLASRDRNPSRNKQNHPHKWAQIADKIAMQSMKSVKYSLYVKYIRLDKRREALR